MPYSKYNLYYKNKTRKPRSTEHYNRHKNKNKKSTLASKSFCEPGQTIKNDFVDFRSHDTINDYVDFHSLDTTQIVSNISQVNESVDFNEIRYISNRNPNEDESQLNEDLICQSLVSLSYATNMTHSALPLVAELTQLVTNSNNMPKRFRDLVTRVSNEVNYTKIWFCQSCSVQIILSKPTQRECEICKNRYTLIIYFYHLKITFYHTSFYF
jgi:rubrerythrin